MEIPAAYIDKFQAKVVENRPRSNRDVLVADFLKVLNEENKRDGYAPYTTGRLVKLFKGRTDSYLYRLFNECSAPGVKKFGGLMITKLRQP